MFGIENSGPWYDKLIAPDRADTAPRRLPWPAAVLLIGLLCTGLWGMIWLVVSLITG